MGKIKKMFSSIVVFTDKNTICYIGILLCCFCLLLITENKSYSNQIIKNFENESKNIVLKKTNNGLILPLIPNDLVSTSIRNDSFWEGHVTNFITKHVKPGDKVIECGAHIGYYTTLLGKIVGKNGHIYSYEANDEVFWFADTAVKINDMTDIVTLKNLCVSNNNGYTNFNCFDKGTHYNELSNIGASCLSFHNDKDLDHNFHTKSVKTIKLDDDINTDLHNKINWIRMDIEGAEILALEGAQNILRSSKDIKIIMEFSTKMLNRYGKAESLIRFLFDEGFSAYFILNNGETSQKLSFDDLMKVDDLSDIYLSRD